MAKEVMSDRFTQLWTKVQAEIPGVSIIRHEDSWFLRAIHFFLNKILRIDKNYGSFTTTIGRTLYVPNTFRVWSPDDRYKLLRHELIHLRQFRCWPIPLLNKRFLWVINALIMGFCYLLVLPAKYTFRAKFEREGYLQTMLVHYELGRLNRPYSELTLRNHLVETFSGPTYLYMDRRERAEKWVDEALSKIKTGEIVNDQDRIDL